MLAPDPSGKYQKVLFLHENPLLFSGNTQEQLWHLIFTSPESILWMSDSFLKVPLRCEPQGQFVMGPLQSESNPREIHISQFAFSSPQTLCGNGPP